MKNQKVKFDKIFNRIPCLGVSMGIAALKKLFLSGFVCDLACEDIPEPFIGQKNVVFKIPLVGTPNLCLKMSQHRAKHLNLKR